MMNRVLLVVLAVAVAITVCVGVVEGAFCHGKPDGGVPNNNPIWRGDPRFLRNVTNGTLYEVGQGEDTIKVAHVFGDPYAMGYAYGSLLKDEMLEFFPQVWKHFEEQITPSIPDWIPAWMAEIIANEGLDAGLDAVWLASKQYTPSYVEQEQQGLADATGASYKMIRRIHLIGEITKGRCSMFGVWGDATPDGGLLQLRALDWDTDGPLQDFPAVVVYHPDEGYGHAFANVGWAGWMGVLTGASSKQMAVSEIGVSYPDDTWGNETFFGIPFVYMLRDVLQFDDTLDSAISDMADEQRTCHLILGVGDGKLGYFRGFEYSHTVLDVFDPMNMRPEADWHPRIPDAVYWGMDWLCPSFSEKLADEIKSHYGNLTAEAAIQFLGEVKTGDLHVAFYDLTHQHMYVANARASTESGPNFAYDRQYVHFDLAAMWAEPRPTAGDLYSSLVTENAQL